MVFVCNLRNIHCLANVVILFAIKTCQACQYTKSIARIYMRERHEDRNTHAFWATMCITCCLSPKMAAKQIGIMANMLLHVIMI